LFSYSADLVGAAGSGKGLGSRLLFPALATGSGRYCRFERHLMQSQVQQLPRYPTIIKQIDQRTRLNAGFDVWLLSIDTLRNRLRNVHTQVLRAFILFMSGQQLQKFPIDQ